VALGRGIAQLEDFYKKLSFCDSQDSQCFFPFIRQYTVGEQIVKFSYKAYLTEKVSESPSKVIFLATTETENRQESCQEIVVKFV
jgi:hypothetical protein